MTSCRGSLRSCSRRGCGSGRRGTARRRRGRRRRRLGKRRPVPGAIIKTKGMTQTCQKLIQIFLVFGRTEYGLTDAAEEVLGLLSPAEEANAYRVMKTIIRCMYDITNVLQSIGILVKENVGSTNLQNRPSFRRVYGVPPCDVARYLGTGPRPETAGPGWRCCRWPW